MATPNTGEGWDSVWERKGFFISVINAGRECYNLFFRRLLLKHLTPRTDMIELGCGSSTLTLSLAGKLKSITGIDRSKEALALSEKYAEQKNATNATFLSADILHLPDELKNRFGLVWSQGLMEHFDDYLPVVRAHYDAVKRGGTVLISVPYRYSYLYPWYAATRNNLLARFWPYADQKFLTKKELRGLGQKIGAPYKVYFLPPLGIGFLMGIVVLEIRKG
jgi:SAM-dependent methyltransferase